MRFALVARDTGATVDAIRDHTHHLAEALRREGVDADVHLLEPDRRLVEVLARYDLAVVQYNPFMWGRRGFAPRLPLELWRLRNRRQRPRIALLVHETAMPLTSPRWAAMGLWQRAQLRAVRPAADVVFASIEPWADALARQVPHRPTRHLPTPSTLPDMRPARERTRRELALGDDTIALATLSTGHPMQRLDLAARAAERVAANGTKTALLVLGAGAKVPAGLPPEVRCVTPGLLPADALAAHLAAGDLFLAPFGDGVSTRRTSVMAALQHELAVVGTRGSSTGASLADSGALALADDAAAFASLAADLAGDSVRRSELAAAGRGLYVERFDWPVAARAILADAT